MTLEQGWADDGDTGEVWRENQAGEENKKQQENRTEI